MTNPHIDLNPDFVRAFERIERSRANVFITGNAGTGKSTFLQHLRENTGKKCVVLAPTGVAAVHVKGQTIHSFFHFRPDITVEAVPRVRFDPRQKKLYRNLELLIIDEISMVRADLFDCVDAFLKMYGPRKGQPFGGVQLVVIGDLHQLSPVVTNDEKHLFSAHYPGAYFFDARATPGLGLEIIEFHKNYRQDDEHFIDLLNRVRTATAEQEHIDAFNERCLPQWEADESEFTVYLTTTNRLADSLNDRKLEELKEDVYVSPGQITGEFERRSLPTAEELELKIGAQVILLNNDGKGRWVNGSVGKILDVIDAGPAARAVQVELADGRQVEVEPFTWEIYKFTFDEDANAVNAESVGTFRQFPIKLAWAITIHKAQGKTFDRVVIDLGRGAFCHGQLYVALSRCRTLGGIVLKRPISRRDIHLDRRVSEYLSGALMRQAAASFTAERKEEIIRDAIDDGADLELVYLRETHERHRRRISPRLLRMVHHGGELQSGVEAFCHERGENYVFRLRNIIELCRSDAAVSEKFKG